MLAAAATFALCAQVAWAQSAPEPVRIAISAPQGCVDPQSFLGSIQTRTARARLASDTEQARSFGVYISRDANRSRGALVITEIDGRSSSRQIEGATCKEVASALGLIAALAIDPDAQPGNLPPAASPPVIVPPPQCAPAWGCPSCPAPPAPHSTAAQPLHLGISSGPGLSGGFAPGASLERGVQVAAGHSWPLRPRRRDRAAVGNPPK